MLSIYENKLKKIFTEEEMLYDKMSKDRFIEYLKRDDVEIISCNRSDNSYGNFLFVSTHLKIKGLPKYFKGRMCLTFYGFGCHEYRNQYLTDFVSIYSGNDFDEKTRFDKGQAIRMIEIEYHTYKARELEDGLKPNRTYSEIADISDEDFAMTFMEDMGLE